MARITLQARKAALRRVNRSSSFIDGVLDEELGGGLGSLLGGIAGTAVGGPIGTALGSSIGGALLDGGGSSGGSGGSSGGSGGSSAGAAASKPVATGPSVPTVTGKPGASRSDVRAIVQDALAAHAGTQAAQQAQVAETRQAARDTAETVTAALDPTARATRGAVQVQRLQAQAQAEHNAIARREAATRTQTERFNTLKSTLAQILVEARKTNARLSGRTAVVVGRAIDVLGGDAVLGAAPATSR